MGIAAATALGTPSRCAPTARGPTTTCPSRYDRIRQRARATRTAGNMGSCAQSLSKQAEAHLAGSGYDWQRHALPPFGLCMSRHCTILPKRRDSVHSCAWGVRLCVASTYMRVPREKVSLSARGVVCGQETELDGARARASGMGAWTCGGNHRPSAAKYPWAGGTSGGPW